MTASRKLTLVLCLAASAGCTLDDLLGGVTTVNGKVGAACKQDANCRPGLKCTAAETCAPTGDRAEGGNCILSEECGAGLYCALNLECAPAGTGKAGDGCQSPGACEKGLFCQLKGTNGVCTASGTGDIDAACTTAADCFGGLFCVSKKCTAVFDLPDRLPEESCALTGTLEGTFRTYFDVPRGDAKLADFYRLPFPNDVRKKNGHISINGHMTPGDALVGIDIVQMYIDRATEDLEGFGTSSAVFFRFSGPLNFSTVAGGGSTPTLQWIDLSNDQPRGLEYQWDPNRGRYICHNNLIVRPPAGDPLRGARTYAVILTTGIKDPNGTALAQDADFAAMLETAAPSDADLAAAHAAYQPLRDYLTRKSIDKSTIAAAAVFTTQDPEKPMNKLRGAVYAAAAPVPKDVTLCTTGATSPCASNGVAADPDRACGPTSSAFHEIHFKASLPIFQHGTAPYKAPEDGGDIQLDSNGVPTLARMEDVCFSLTVPKGATMPTGGWPIVIYGHGTGGNFRSDIDDGTAANLASASPGAGEPVHFAVLSYDQIEHGPRRGGDGTKPDNLVFNFLNPRGSRDNFLQGAADAFAAVRLAKSLSIAAGITGTAVTGDPAHIYFEGHSQGGTHGPMFLAYETDVKTAILSGAGALLIESLLNKHQPIDIAKGMQLAMAELKEVNEYHPILNLFQAYFERSDPVNFGRLITIDPPTTGKWKHVFQTYGVGDNYTPDKTLQNLALSMNVDLVNPVAHDFALDKVNTPVKGNRRAGQQTAVMQQYTPDGYDGHFVIFHDANAMRRAAAWFATAYLDANGIPTLIQ